MSSSGAPQTELRLLRLAALASEDPTAYPRLSLGCPRTTQLLGVFINFLNSSTIFTGIGSTP